MPPLQIPACTSMFWRMLRTFSSTESFTHRFSPVVLLDALLGSLPIPQEAVDSRPSGRNTQPLGVSPSVYDFSLGVCRAAIQTIGHDSLEQTKLSECVSTEQKLSSDSEKQRNCYDIQKAVIKMCRLLNGKSVTRTGQHRLKQFELELFNIVRL